MNHRRWLSVLLVATMLWTACAMADAMRPTHFDDPDRDRLYRGLLEELRCTVCQNQSLADSNAGLATDLRREVRQLVADGADRDGVIDFMVSRYGDFVLYRPPLRPATLLLWTGPFLVLGAGGLMWFVTVRNAASAPATAGLTDTERLRARRLLNGERS